MLDLHIDLIAITFISFIALIFLLNKILYKPLLGFVDRRDSSMRDDISNASKNLGDIGDAESEISSNLEEARRKADNLRQEATREALEYQEEQVEVLRKELDTKYDEFLVSLSKEKDSCRESILSKVPLLRENFDKKLSSI